MTSLYLDETIPIMNVYYYDKTFDGLMSAVFDAYERKVFPDILLAEGSPLPLFSDNIHTVSTDDNNANRVWTALEKKLSAGAIKMIKAVWLSEEVDSDLLLFRYIRKSFDSKASIESNFGDEDVLAMLKLAKAVNREAEHICQFIRFQKTADGIYFAPIELKYNALPLTIEYFFYRFSDQKWVVYDTTRMYGFHYDLKKVEEFTFDLEVPLSSSGKLHPDQLEESEVKFQEFWKSYIQSMTIKERINKKLQKQHMPVRFWKFLTEKQ